MNRKQNSESTDNLNVVKMSVTMKPQIEKQIRKRQSQLLLTTNKTHSFSSVMNEVLEAGLKVIKGVKPN